MHRRFSYVVSIDCPGININAEAYSLEGNYDMTGLVGCFIAQVGKDTPRVI